MYKELLFGARRKHRAKSIKGEEVPKLELMLAVANFRTGLEVEIDALFAKTFGTKHTLNESDAQICLASHIIRNALEISSSTTAIDYKLTSQQWHWIWAQMRRRNWNPFF